jgi:hypothetical protein
LLLQSQGLTARNTGGGGEGDTRGETQSARGVRDSKGLGVEGAEGGQAYWRRGEEIWPARAGRYRQWRESTDGIPVFGRTRGLPGTNARGIPQDSLCLEPCAVQWGERQGGRRLFRGIGCGGDITQKTKNHIRSDNFGDMDFCLACPLYEKSNHCPVPFG